MSYIYLATIEVNDGNEPIFVSANVEYDKITDLVRRWEGSSQGFEAGKVMVVHDLEPPRQSIGTVMVQFSKLSQYFSRYNMHIDDRAHGSSGLLSIADGDGAAVYAATTSDRVGGFVASQY